MKIATASLNAIWEDKSANLIQVEKIINSLKGRTEYLIFPEMTLSGFYIKNIDLAENIDNSNSIRKIRKLDKENKINILFGLMTNKKNKIYNSCICINSKRDIECI